MTLKWTVTYHHPTRDKTNRPKSSEHDTKEVADAEARRVLCELVSSDDGEWCARLTPGVRGSVAPQPKLDSPYKITADDLDCDNLA